MRAKNFNLRATKMCAKSLLATDYPSADDWKTIVKTFSPDAIAHKFLLASVPWIFRNEPVKYALFRKTIADAFKVAPTDVFIVGSAMAGRSLKGKDIEKEYSSDSDIDTLIVSEHLFASYTMKSFEWVKDVTSPTEAGVPYTPPPLAPEAVTSIGRLAMNACKGIWRPDSLPKDAAAREEFMSRFSAVSLKVLGLQLSEDTVSHVTGRIARSFEDAVHDFAGSLRKLGYEFEKLDDRNKSGKK